jgi:hypothetical protein
MIGTTGSQSPHLGRFDLRIDAQLGVTECEEDSAAAAGAGGGGQTGSSSRTRRQCRLGSRRVVVVTKPLINDNTSVREVVLSSSLTLTPISD